MKRKLLALAALIVVIGGGAALAEFTEVADPVIVSATAGSGCLEADLSFTPDAYEIVRRPYGDESADWAHHRARRPPGRAQLQPYRQPGQGIRRPAGVLRSVRR